MVVGLLMCLSAAAEGQLQPATSRISLEALSQRSERDQVGAATGTLDDTIITPITGGTRQRIGVAQASTAAGLPPSATASAESSHAESPPQDDLATAADASASAGLSYQVRVGQRKQPPIVFRPRIHLTAQMSGSVSANGGIASASASVSINAPGFFNTSEAAFANSINQMVNGFNRTVGFFVEPGAIINVTTSASANTATNNRLPSQLSQASAFADPLFEFDQSAFEAYADAEGFEPFDLAEFYAIEYSPNIIPEPATGLLLLAAAAAAPAQRRRRS
jgi:hypothetical protein